MKRLRLRISGDAAREITDALAWRAAAPQALKEDLQHGLELIRTQPGVGGLALNVRLPGVLRINLSRVCYFVYYSVSEDGSTIEVLRFWHSSRGVGPNI